MITTAELSHPHRFVPATASGKSPILLLHGTGGDENDLLPLGQTVAPGAALLSPRGKVASVRAAAQGDRGGTARNRCVDHAR